MFNEIQLNIGTYVVVSIVLKKSSVQFTSLWKQHVSKIEKKIVVLLQKNGRSDILHRDFILMKYKILTLSQNKTETREITR